MSKSGKSCIAIGLFMIVCALALGIYNIVSDLNAGISADRITGSLRQDIAGAEASELILKESADETYIPDYILNPKMDMPEEEIDGQSYIGILTIPELSLSLPVISEWSYPRLRKAPCRYYGSVYLNNMVIAAHNYKTHFGRLKELSKGDELSFTDTDGNVFHYKVAETETLSPYAVEEMTKGEGGLTLFTCTVGGKTRIAVRCELADGYGLSEHSS